MRIISQNGKWDYPYDMVIIKRYENMIFAITNLMVNVGSSVEMATYSTPEKADKAMELLRQAYTGRYITNAEVSEDFEKTMQELMKHGFGTVIVRDRNDSRVEFENLNGYFKFPSDEEIEVNSKHDRQCRGNDE